MKTALFTAIVLCAVPVLAGDAPSDTPPSPPPVQYDVWGFRWNGRQYEKDAGHSLSTTDIKQATDYAAQLTSYAGWRATTNLPPACVVHTVYHGPAISAAMPNDFPAQPTYSVWAFKQSGGKWVKDDAYSWTTTDPLRALDYAKQVNAVKGWTTTTNCPDVLPQAQRFVDGGKVQGADAYKNLPLQVYEPIYGPALPNNFLGQMVGLAQRYANAYGRRYGNSYSTNDTSSTYDPTFDTSIQDANNLQDMLNQQNWFNTQQMLNNQMLQNNIQDMINTQQMIDTQNMVNTQQMIDNQNMINAMNNP